MWNTILFDLDGTLTDSAEGITKSVQYALAHFGIQEADLKKLECFVGPPLKEQFMKYAGFTPEQAEEAIGVYRERYQETGIWENYPYPGVKHMLEKLCNRGFSLGVASSKPTYFVRQILEKFELLPYFQAVVGSEMDGRRTDKAEVIEEALRQMNTREFRQQVLMVGDKEHDVLGARKVGIPCVGVAYGYGTRGELLTAQPLVIVSSVMELESFLTEGRLLDSQPAVGQEGKDRGTLAEETVGRDLHRGRPVLQIWRVLYPIGIHFGAGVVAVMAGMMLAVMASVALGVRGGNMVNGWFSDTVFLTGLNNAIALPISIYFFRRDRILRGEAVKPGGNTGGWKSKGITPAVILVLIFFAASCGDLLNNAIVFLRIPDLFPFYGEIAEEIYTDTSMAGVLLVVGVLAPITEEFVFRGLVFQRIRDYMGVKWGILISGLLFGMYHGNMVQFIFATCLGWLFAWLYYRSGSIILPILAHVAVNVWSSLISEIPSDHSFFTWYPLFVVAEILITVWGGYFLAQRYRISSKEQKII